MLHFCIHFICTPLHNSPALEELSIRSNMALVQKRVVHDITAGTESTVTESEDFEQEYLRLSAQVVSCFGLCLILIPIFLSSHRKMHIIVRCLLIRFRTR